MFIKFTVVSLFSAMALAGCSATPIQTRAARIPIVSTEPQGCEYLGEVTGNQGNSFTGKWTSNSNLETGARNDMKNQASKMGGNVIHMLTNRAGQTGSYSLYGGSSAQTNVTYVGAVYRCKNVSQQARSKARTQRVTAKDSELDL